MDGDPLEAGGLLEAVANAQAGTFSDRKARHILAVVEDLPLRGLYQAHDHLGQGSLAAAVGAGENYQLMVGNG